MSTQSTQPRAGGGQRLERAIILQLLRADREASWSREELAIELGGDMAPVEDALARLRDDGLLSVADQQLSASPVARRLDELGLIGV
jgi:DNA-binding GntR family transcriptional regulator